MGGVKIRIEGDGESIDEAARRIAALGDARVYNRIYEYSGPPWRDCVAGKVDIFLALAPETTKPAPQCLDPVTIVDGNGRERYAELRAYGARPIVRLLWGGEVHAFDRATGECIESVDGIMRGWKIHPGELSRFQVKHG